MRALIAMAFAALLGAIVGACGASGAVVAPSWARSALATEEADVVVAMNVALLRRDPIFYRATQRLANKDKLAWLLRASQIDLVANADDGELRSWVGAVHGLDGAPAEGEVRDLGTSRRLASGTTEYAYPRGAMLVFPNAWVFAQGAALERMRAAPPATLGRISMQDGAILEATVRARALSSRWSAKAARLADGLRDGTLVILGGDRLAMIVRCRYVDVHSAEHAETESRAQLAAISSRHELVLAIVQELVEIDLARSGDTVTWRIEAKEKLRDYVREYAERESRDSDVGRLPPPPAPPSPESPSYPTACPPGQRWDLDRRACVEAR
jgi:hypothetical protein